MSSNTSNKRISFASTKNQLQYPDFLEVQLKSFKDFFQLGTTPENRKNEGLYTVFKENFPITDTRNNFVLEFLDYFIDPPRYSIDECLEQGLTYGAPLKAKLKLYCTDPEHEDFDTVIEDVYLGNVPYMTPKGTFVINGAERVIVSQLHRSPGVFFGQSVHANGTKLYSARIIPFKGSWIEFATDINNVMYAYIDRKKKLPVTTLLRAIGFETDKDILQIFDLADEINVSKTGLKKVVGRRLAARVLKTWVEDFVDEDTGEVVSIERNEIIVDRETVLENEHIDAIVDSGAKTILLHKEKQNLADYAIIYNTLQKDPCNSEKEAVMHIYRQLRSSEPPDEATARDVIDKLFFSDKRYDLGDVGRYKLNKKLGLSTDPAVRVLTKEDMIEIIKYLIKLLNARTDVDDIDHLSNRRVRTVGEQLYNQFGVGLARMARTIRERMNVRDNEVFTPVDLINSKILSSVINSFFGTNALSQFMDQTNPLAEITHKRRMSALGPGGLSRDRAGFEVRDVHYTHYGRLCPIETPEGPNIGLISSLCVYAKINDLGFIETPYRKVEAGVVDLSPEGVKYLSAEEEEGLVIAQANAKIDDEGHFVNKRAKSRKDGDFPVEEIENVNLMDVAPNQIASIAASLIPFLEHDDANRALMATSINFSTDKPFPSPPSRQNWLGTDANGGDVLARILYGTRISVLFGLMLTLCSSVMGVLAGALQGYYGGKVDLWGQRFIEVWSGMPTLFLIILLSSVVQPNFWWLLAITVLFGWMSLVGVVRAEFLRTRNFDYIRAAQALGVSDRSIILRHMLPNAMVATLTFLPFILCSSITTLTSLDFLGFGLPLGSPSLGELLLQGKNNLQAPWLGITAFLSVAILLSLLIFIGEAVRDAFDPNKAV